MLVVFLIVFLTQDIQACGSTGGSGCCRKRQTYSQPSCSSGCQPGYQCGSYGCARRRALAGITERIDGAIVSDEHGEQANTAPLTEDHLLVLSQQKVSFEKLTNPNYLFKSCCETRGLPDACLKHCHFNSYSARMLERMWNKQDGCSIEAANEIHFCAAQGLDHQKCCAIEGVASTLAGKKCLAFCDQRPNRFTTLDISYLPCLSVFEQMKRCFYLEIKSRAEDKFSGIEEVSVL